MKTEPRKWVNQPWSENVLSCVFCIASSYKSNLHELAHSPCAVLVEPFRMDSCRSANHSLGDAGTENNTISKLDSTLYIHSFSLFFFFFLKIPYFNHNNWHALIPMVDVPSFFFWKSSVKMWLNETEEEKRKKGETMMLGKNSKTNRQLLPRWRRWLLLRWRSVWWLRLRCYRRWWIYRCWWMCCDRCSRRWWCHYLVCPLIQAKNNENGEEIR